MLVQRFATYIESSFMGVEIELGKFTFKCTTTETDVVIDTYIGNIPRRFSIPKKEKIGVLVMILSEVTRVVNKDGSYSTINPIVIVRTLNDLLLPVPNTDKNGDFEKLVAGLQSINAPVTLGYEDARTVIKYENGHVVVTTSFVNKIDQVSYFGDFDNLNMLARHIVSKYDVATTSRLPSHTEVLTVLEGIV